MSGGSAITYATSNVIAMNTPYIAVPYIVVHIAVNTPYIAVLYIVVHKS